MNTEIKLPADPLARFQEIYAALSGDKKWFHDASPLRFAAMSAMLCPGDARSVAAGIRQIGEDIKQESGWCGQLNGDLRFIVAAMLLLRGDTAKGLLTEVKRVQKMFRDASIRRGSIYETMAIFVLRMQSDQKPIQTTAIHRFKAIYEEMKKYHWWLTGPDDFPACAILTGRSDSVTAMGSRIERIYQALKTEGFSAGDPLQTAANILCLAKGQPNEIAHRYRALADGFKAASIRIWQSDYDELAILTFLDHPARIIVARVVKYRVHMTALRPKPDVSLTFNLASSIAFCDLIKLDDQLKEITDTKALLDMQAILAAQQAAAAAAASTAAATAAASH
jgi:Protein of unknown function (DUF4003)